MFNMLEYLGNRPMETSIVGLGITIVSRLIYKISYYIPVFSIDLAYAKDWVYIISAGLGGLLSLLGIIGWFLKHTKTEKNEN